MGVSPFQYSGGVVACSAGRGKPSGSAILFSVVNSFSQCSNDELSRNCLLNFYFHFIFTTSLRSAIHVKDSAIRTAANVCFHTLFIRGFHVN